MRTERTSAGGHAGRAAVPSREVMIEAHGIRLPGTLALPPDSTAIVLFAHGSGSGRASPRNRQVARALHAGGLGTLLFDLLTDEEEAVDRFSGRLRFAIELLAARLTDATDWLLRDPEAGGHALGYFGASTGAAAALEAAVLFGEQLGAIVSRGGRPDLAMESLDQVRAPTLLIVGERDDAVAGMNRRAFDALQCEKELVTVPGATHLFQEPGALEQVSKLALAWFRRHLVQA